MNLRTIKFFAILFILPVGFPACSPAPPPRALTPVTVQLAWFHQAQFAGFYTADQQGYYSTEGDPTAPTRTRR